MPFHMNLKYREDAERRIRLGFSRTMWKKDGALQFHAGPPSIPPPPTSTHTCSHCGRGHSTPSTQIPTGGQASARAPSTPGAHIQRAGAMAPSTLCTAGGEAPFGRFPPGAAGGRLRGSLHSCAHHAHSLVGRAPPRLPPPFWGAAFAFGQHLHPPPGRERLLPPLCVLHPPCTCRGRALPAGSAHHPRGGRLLWHPPRLR